MRLWSSSEYTANAIPFCGSTISASVRDPLPPPVPPDSQLPLGDAVAERPRHEVELVPDRRRDPRPRDQDHQDDDRNDQDVFDCRLPFQAAGKSTRYPPPKGISAACMCGSSRIGFEFTRKRSPRLIRSVRNAAAALLVSLSHMPTHLHGSHHTSLRSVPLRIYLTTRLPSYTPAELHVKHSARQRGARNGTPQESCLLLSFLSLSLFRRSALRRQLLISSHNGGRSSYSESEGCHGRRRRQRPFYQSTVASVGIALSTAAYSVG